MPPKVGKLDESGFLTTKINYSRMVNTKEKVQNNEKRVKA
jgi:hypothetical protein